MTVFHELVGRNQMSSQPDASMHPNMYFRFENFFKAEVNYEHTLSRGIQHISIVSLLQEKVTVCCDLPTLSSLPYSYYIYKT